MRLHIKLLSLTIALLFIGSIGVVAVSAQSSTEGSCAGIVPSQAAIPINTMQFRYNATHTGDYSPVAGSNMSNGKLTWRLTTGGYILSSPAVANGVVYVGSYDNSVYAIGNAAVATSQGMTPGFEVMLAFVGLVITAYVVGRRG